MINHDNNHAETNTKKKESTQINPQFTQKTPKIRIPKTIKKYWKNSQNQTSWSVQKRREWLFGVKSKSKISNTKMLLEGIEPSTLGS